MVPQQQQHEEGVSSTTGSKTVSGRELASAVITGLILFVAISTFYARSVNYGFIYDDYKLIVNVRPPRSADEVLSVFTEGHWEGLPYYRPVARLTMVVQKALHGESPAGYHGFNALLMGGLAVVTWWLFRQPPLGIRRWLAVLGALLVALHPVASCTVYPICSGRETLMPAIFILAAVTAFLKPGRLWYAVGMVTFAVSLLCKEQAVIVPGIFVLADLLGLSSAAPIRGIAGWLRRYLVVFGILAAYLLVRWLMFHGSGEHRLSVLDRPDGPVLSLLYAFQVTFVPFVQLVYEPPVDVWISEWRAIVCLVVIFGMGIVTYRHWSTARKTALFWLGWFFLALLPTANLLEQEAPFAERYVLLAVIGVIGLAAMLASLQWDRASARHVIIFCGLALLVACGSVSWQRGQYFASNIRFHTQWVRTSPASDHAQCTLGWVLLQDDRLGEAVVHLEESLRLNPGVADTYNNLGAVYSRSGDSAKALPYFTVAIRLEPDNVEAHNNLGMVLGKLGDISKAVDHFESALRIDPDYSDAHNNLGVTLVKQGELDAAAAHFEKAVELKPNDPHAHNNLASALAAKGELARAAEHYRSALAIDPDYAAARARLEQVRDELRRREK